MASTDAGGARAEHCYAARAAGRFLDADYTSLAGIDEDVDTRDDQDASEADGAAAWRPTTVETMRPTSRPASQERQPSHGRAFSSGRSQPVVSRRGSSDDAFSSQLQDCAAYGQPTSALAPPLQPSSGSSSSIGRRHPNGLPARVPSGPLPGMPILSELLSRYPARQARGIGHQISLVSGQLYVSDRLREAATFQKAPPAPSAHSPVHTAVSLFPAPEMLIPTYAHDGCAPPSSYLEQRRVEREQRAVYTGLHHHSPQLEQQQQLQQQAGRSSWPPHDTSAARAGTAAAGADGRNSGVSGVGGARAATPGNARQRVAREGVERWLETSADSGGAEQDAAAGSSRLTSDPSLIYRQYGIFRTYGKVSHGLWPSLSMTVHSRTGGHKVAFERKRTSSGAGGGGGGGGGGGPGVSPMRVSPPPALAWGSQLQPAPTRQGAW